MPFTVTLPKLTPTMESGSIVKWHKTVGDHVESGELILEIATDKATVEHNALDAGWLRKILVQEGAEAHVNQPIAIFTEEKNESIEGYQIPQDKEAKEKKKRDAEEVKKVSASSSQEKQEHEHEKEEGQSKKQSASMTGMSQPSFIPEQPLKDYQFELPSGKVEKRILASPLAKKIAKEKGLDLTTVKGTGPNQRIMSRDLERAQHQSAAAFGHREVPLLDPGSYDEESLTPIRKVIGQRLQESKTFIPHFYVQQTVDAEPLVAIRDQLVVFGNKVSFNDYVVRACALALREHPVINSGYNSQNQTIIRFKTIDISVAVTVNGGLITPIVRHADYKNVGEISVEIKSLAKRAKEGKLESHEYKGGSFTVSNLGMFGVTDFQAIINPPQAAILAVSGIHDTPVVKNGCVVPGKTMNMTLSADHRVIDGVAAAQFMKTLQKYLENPAILIV